jgi:hypothetical protein
LRLGFVVLISRSNIRKNEGRARLFIADLRHLRVIAFVGGS